MAKQTVKITRTKTTRTRAPRKTAPKGSNQKRCPSCGRYK